MTQTESDRRAAREWAEQRGWRVDADGTVIAALAELVAAGREEAAKVVLQLAATPAIDLDLRDRETVAAAIRKGGLAVSREHHRAECECESCRPARAPSTPPAPGPEMPLSADELHWLACEVSHDIRCAMTEAEGLNRIRWNNRAVMRFFATIRDLETRLAAAESAMAAMTAERDESRAEVERIKDRLARVARIHGCPSHVVAYVRSEVDQDPNDEWSPYRLKRERDAERASAGRLKARTAELEAFVRYVADYEIFFACQVKSLEGQPDSAINVSDPKGAVVLWTRHAAALAAPEPDGRVPTI